MSADAGCSRLKWVCAGMTVYMEQSLWDRTRGFPGF